ncbi:glutamyl-tRNA(Gln) amidotransferase subunit A, mitochondrial [Toxorhynchites rutilus septentrionalis]|uniref:glutamyl-tRNA(Gln) amidotransferase subunit A, mitochondrial n=1 Tax=Toxorhynchites rutilus septentrionalis TaxID=329112 RepID=UPI00247943FE|nr:glutamyl-tRNA(Gln) amidotransferase subunit A, mitochondrial [Toxorhynchites rutilus septentrionalis]
MNRRLPLMLKELSECYRSKAFEPLAVTEQTLARAKNLKELNAFIRTTPTKALHQAEQSVQRYKQGKPVSILDGAPIAVKDNFCTKDIHTTCASRMLQNFVPPYNATVYDRLERSGAILIGKTNMDQFGMGSGTVDSIFGATKNFWSESLRGTDFRIAGGSSGGSAVAVASGVCFAALGSDTGGSTRNPASYCGVVGFKPTYGLLSRHGLVPLVNSMDVPGILTRTVDDCAAVFNAIAGPDQHDSTTVKKPFDAILVSEVDRISLKGLKVGIPVEYHCDGISGEVLSTWSKVADMLEDAGATVKAVSLPYTSASISVYSILNQCEASSNMSRYDGIEYGHRSDENSSTEQLYARTRAEGFTAVVKNRILAGNFFLLRKNYDTYFQKALKVRRLIANDFDRAFREVDILLTPTTLSDAPLYEEFTKSHNRDQCAVQDFCTQSANMGGIPAISIPIKLSEKKLPISLQLMGPSFSEKALFDVAKWIEAQVQFVECYLDR